MPKRLRVATTNAHKLQEFRALFTPLNVSVEGAPPGFTVVEDGSTFVANAVKKAQALLKQTGEACVADDSGLEVDALQGAPGVRSARYGEPFAKGVDPNAANREKLLHALRDVPEAQRTARFVCVLAYCAPQAAPMLFSGTVAGHIGLVEVGAGGFGYDALFVPLQETLTFAQLPMARKNQLSHRGQALLQLVHYLR